MQYTLVGLLLVTCCCFADVGDVWPTQDELDKAPERPAVLSVDVNNCEAPDVDLFRDTMKAKAYHEDDVYRIAIGGLMDLNLDGVCEIIAFQPVYCGTGGCSNDVFQWDGDEFRFMGMGPSGGRVSFHELHNGYLQFRDTSYTGSTYYYHYYRFEDGQYWRWRADEFEKTWFQETREGKTFYQSTEYFERPPSRPAQGDSVRKIASVPTSGIPSTGAHESEQISDNREDAVSPAMLQTDVELDELIQSLSTIDNAYELSVKIMTIPRLGPLDDEHIVQIRSTLEGLVASIEDGLVKEELNRGIQSYFQTLQYVNLDQEQRFGLVQVGKNSIFLHTAHRGLISGTQIETLFPHVRFLVMKRANIERDSWIPLHVGSKTVVTYDIAPETLKLDPAQIDSRIAYFGGECLRKDLSQSSCTSSEGIHHSVWLLSGPKKSRIWSAYQFLGYAVEPTCSGDELVR